MNFITSLENPLIKNIGKLRKNRERDVQGSFLVDGKREINLALDAEFELINFIYCPELSQSKEDFLKISSKIKTDKIIQVLPKVFNKICYKENPDGFIANFKKKSSDMQNIKLDKKPLIVILEKVEKPGNLGAIIRTSYAAGVDLIILNDSQIDIYNPNVIRASEGYIFLEKIVCLSQDETVVWLQKNKITSFAASTKGKINYVNADMSESTAIVLGSEADGLSLKWHKKADKLIKIPMVKGVDSLNVSVSAAIIIFEALRQRSL